MDQVAQHARGDALAGGIHRHDALGVDGLPLAGQDLVRLDRERGPAAAPADAAAQAEHHALLEHLGQPGLIEPDADHDARLVAQHRLQDRHPAAVAVLQGDALDRGPDRRLLTDLESRDRLAVGEVLVASRVVLEKVADGRETKAGQPPGQRRPHAGQIGQRTREAGGVGGKKGRLRSLVVAAAGEAQERPAAHSTIIAKANTPGPP